MRKSISQKDLARAKLYLEYKKDIVKWAAECVYLPTPGGDMLCELYEPQKRVLTSFLKDNYLCLLKSRQTGFSTLSQIICAHMATFYSNVVIGIISRDSAESSDFNRKVLDILHKQPTWLRPTFRFENAQSFSTTKGTQLWTSAVSPANPGAVFRGKAITILIMDESAHVRLIDEAWTGIAPALSKAQNAAKLNGIPFGTIVLSTPNRTQGIGKWYFDRWTQAVANPDGLWKPHKIHWKEIPAFRDDPNWYSQQCEILENNPKKIAQELELQFVPAGGMFDETVYAKLQEQRELPTEKIRVNDVSDIWRFKEIDRKRFYIVGVDTASEFGRDWSAIQVLDYITMEQIMEFRGKLAVKDFSLILKRISGLVPNNFIIIENNSYGNQVCEEMFYDEHMNFNIYGSWKKILTPGSQHKMRKFQPGLSTNMKTRPLIMDALYNYVTEDPDSIASERLAMELVSLVDKGKGKVEADHGANDDLAMAYAFCCYARSFLKAESGQSLYTDNESGLEDPMEWMSGLNSNTPLKGASRSMAREDFNKRADQYLSKNFHKFAGQTVNMLDLIEGKKRK